MTLKLGIATYNYLWRFSLKSTLEHIANMKFRWIEIMSTPPQAWPGGFSENDRKELRQQLDSYDLEVVALTPTFGDLNIASPRPSIRKETIKEMKEQVDLARDLDAQIVVLSPGKRPNPLSFATPPVEAIWNLAKDGAIECAKYAEDREITIGLEETPSFFVETAEQLKKMIHEIGMESVKAVYDSSNISVKESPVSSIEILGDLICHVHLSDNDCKKFEKLPVGMGIIDFGSVATALKKVGFEGWSMIEFWYPDDPHGGAIDSKKTLETLGWRA